MQLANNIRMPTKHTHSTRAPTCTCRRTQHTPPTPGPPTHLEVTGVADHVRVGKVDAHHLVLATGGLEGAQGLRGWRGRRAGQSGARAWPPPTPMCGGLPQPNQNNAPKRPMWEQVHLHLRRASLPASMISMAFMSGVWLKGTWVGGEREGGGGDGRGMWVAGFLGASHC